MNPQLANQLEKLVEQPPQRSPSRPPANSPPPTRILGKIIFVIVLAALLAAGWVYRAPLLGLLGAGNSAPATGGGGRGGGAGQPVSVVAAVAQRGDVHVYLVGLGTVTPFVTSTVLTRVDGEIMKIYYKEGQTIHAKDPLVEIDPRPYQDQLESAQGQLLKDQAFLDNAKIDLARYQQGFAEGSVSQQQVATQEATVKQYEGVVKSDQSQIDTANLDLVYCHVTSPINGRIGLQLVNVGNIVHAADTTGLAVITQLQPIAVVFPLSEDDLSQVVGQEGGGVGLTVEAYDRDDIKHLTTGTVEAVDNEVDPTTGTFKIKASFENKDLSLFPNEFVNAHLLVDVKRNVVLVPSAGVQHGPTGSAFAFVVKPDKTVEIRNLQEGAGEGDYTSVTGLQAGEIVVTDGTDRLQDGSKVIVSMSQDTGPATRPSGRGRRGGRAATQPLADGSVPSTQRSGSSEGASQEGQ